MKIIAVWHSDIAHMTAFANNWYIDLIAMLPETNGGHGFWSAYRVNHQMFALITADKNIMWK